MNSGTVFRRAPDHVTRTIGGETLVVPVRARAADLDSLYVFNATGAAIWRLLESPRGAAEIAACLGEAFDAPPERLADDVDAFLAMLQGGGLIEAEGQR